MAIKLVVVDDQTSVREALAVMLGLAEDVDVVATATNGEEAVAVVGEHRPDVVLMDLHMPKLGGVAATAKIHEQAPDVHVVVLTTFEDDESILAALRAGASGYLTKEADRATLLQAVRSASHGQSVLDPRVQRRLLTLATARPVASETPFNLTAREFEILGLIGEGLRNPEIAKRLVISEATVKTHINNLFAKAGFHSRTDAVRYVLNNRVETGLHPGP
ncbi:response regulator [Kutzneria sp. CA-103260]|uniref:response regulator n=1 Tax=Kutzneria sp. CA-103260 TaxID=2802641 RepID=UPI001BAC4921|nr:response regulator transcription factor [Kutzneria sp. CA-103260]QUQ65982.1 response regulator transcription factor [Kutzneria sp. CA-103260]